MARRSYTKDDVQTHYGSDRPAVNVKVYDTLEDGFVAFQKYATSEHGTVDDRFCFDWVRENVTDKTLDAIFWDTCAVGIEQVEIDAGEIFGKCAKIEQDGRMGGWVVVTGLDEIEDWDAVALAKWRRFERLAKGLASDVMYLVVDTLYMNEYAASIEENLFEIVNDEQVRAYA